MHRSRKARTIGAALLAVGAMAATLTACSSGSGSSSASTASASGGTYTFWDPYPQYTASSPWAQLVSKCGTEAGVTVKRTAYDTTALTTQALLAGQQGNSVGTYLCTDLACSLYLRGLQPVTGLGGRIEERLTLAEKAERTMANVAAFVAKVTG